MGPWERRVAIVPEDVSKLTSRHIRLLIQSGAGEGSFFPDSQYASTGVEIIKERNEVILLSDVLVMLGRPTEEDVNTARQGTVFVGMIMPSLNHDLANLIAVKKLVAHSLELLPRTSRAQSMDVLSSQSSVAGYRAAVVGAFHSPRIMPMLSTAAGTIRPAKVLVIGAGVAGLMAISTARRMGASVTAYDVRKAAGEDVRSLGANFLELGIDAVGTGGYARELSADEKEKERMLLEEAIVNSDLIITTAGVPGKKAPLIITRRMVGIMKGGSVIVDITAESGGNCELTRAGDTLEYHGVKVIGLSNAQSEAQVNASQMYSRNMLSFLSVLISADGIIVDPNKDELLKSTLVRPQSPISSGRG